MGWQHYTVKQIESNGIQHLVRDGQWTDERNHIYLPASLPDAILGQRVSIFIRPDEPYRRCAVGEQEYEKIGRQWEPVATCEECGVRVASSAVHVVGLCYGCFMALEGSD